MLQLNIYQQKKKTNVFLLHFGHLFQKYFHLYAWSFVYLNLNTFLAHGRLSQYSIQICGTIAVTSSTRTDTYSNTHTYAHTRTRTHTMTGSSFVRQLFQFSLSLSRSLPGTVGYIIHLVAGTLKPLTSCILAHKNVCNCSAWPHNGRRNFMWLRGKKYCGLTFVLHTLRRAAIFFIIYIVCVQVVLLFLF